MFSLIFHSSVELNYDRDICLLLHSGRKFNCMLYGVLYGMDCLAKVHCIHTVC